jgi:hypothetical protein
VTPPGGVADPTPGNNTSTDSDTVVALSTLTGFVYQDLNNNAVKDPGEPGIPSATVTLTGMDFLGNPVSVTTTTNNTGQYTFGNLLPSDRSGYTITETQPFGFLKGKEMPPSNNFSGTVGPGSYVGTNPNQFSDLYTGIIIAPGSMLTGANYNFGEAILTNTVPGAQTVPEETARLFCNGTPTQVAVNDPNTSDLMQVVLSVTPGTGTLTMTSTNGLTFTSGANGTAAMTFQGTVNAVNLALAHLTFMPARFSGSATTSATMTITGQELDSVGNPVPGVSATNTVPITVTAVNHAPTVQVPPTQATNENTPLVFSAANGNAITLGDPDVDPAVQVERLTLSVSKGTATLATTAGLVSVTGNGAATVTATGTINALNAAVNGLLFTPTKNTYGTGSLVVTLNDLGNIVGPAMQTAKSISISVAQVNQAPVVSGPRSVTRTAGGVAFSGAYLISVADVDAGSSIEQITLTVTTGTLTLGSTTGLTMVSGNGTTSITIQGTLTNLNNALKALRYTGGATTLAVVANDLGNSGPGGPMLGTLNVAIL